MQALIKYFAYAKEIFKGRFGQKNIPIFVTICVTKRCNLNCTYCYLDSYEIKGKEFDAGHLLDLIDELLKMGTKYISLNGGEALLRSDLEIIVDKIRKNNILCHLSTNGLLIEKNVSLLKKIDSLSVSIDGFEDANDLNRGQGTFRKIISAIEFLNKNHIKFHTHTVLTKNNKESVDEIMALALKYGFSAQFSPLRPQDSPNKQINLDDIELKETTKKIMDYKKRGLPIFFSYEPYKNLLNWPYPYNKQMIFDKPPAGYRPITCYIKRFSCHIEPDGLVYPCIVLVNKIQGLNFLEVGFRRAWENLANNNCQACYNVCCNDLNLIFGLKPDAICNALKIALSRSIQRNNQ